VGWWGRGRQSWCCQIEVRSAKRIVRSKTLVHHEVLEVAHFLAPTSVSNNPRKRGFKQSERWAIFLTHNQICYLCSQPLNFRSMRVDHILPESLVKDAEKLAKVLIDYGLPKDFNLNSFSNWLPACEPCNSQKSSKPFIPTPIIQRQLEKACDKAESARKLQHETVSRPKAERALRAVTSSYQSGVLGADDLRELFNALSAAEGPHDGTLSYLTLGSIRLANGFEVVQNLTGDLVIVRAENGSVGLSTKAENPDWSWICSTCGALGPWNGNRCLTCGRMSDPND
jgi:5-methylcytosine-specific restriction endonuclease McrA